MLHVSTNKLCSKLFYETSSTKQHDTPASGQLSTPLINDAATLKTEVKNRNKSPSAVKDDFKVETEISSRPVTFFDSICKCFHIVSEFGRKFELSRVSHFALILLRTQKLVTKSPSRVRELLDHFQHISLHLVVCLWSNTSLYDDFWFLLYLRCVTLLCQLQASTITYHYSSSAWKACWWWLACFLMNPDSPWSRISSRSKTTSTRQLTQTTASATERTLHQHITYTVTATLAPTCMSICFVRRLKWIFMRFTIPQKRLNAAILQIFSH